VNHSWRRRIVVAAVWVAGSALLGRSLASEPGSAQFYRRTLGVAATWTIGGLVHCGRPRDRDRPTRRPVISPVLTGAGAFGAFYGSALLVRHISALDRAVADVMQYAHRGHGPLVAVTTLANGAAEEVFFRGALYHALGPRHPVALSTAAYVLSTTSTRNPALVLASVAMGTLFGLQRRATGGIQAPLLTHLTWSALMLRYLPRLFHRPPQVGHR
jgi:membrane protease YdiL (CAAX protease family)